MKKLYAALIITIIAFNPILAFATGNEEIDDPPALDNIELSQPAEVPTEPSVTPDEIAGIPTDPNAQPQATTPEPPSVPDKSTEDKLENEPTPDNNNTDDLINAPTLNEGDNGDPYNAPVVENELDDTSTLKSEKEVEATLKDDNKDKFPDDKTIIEHEHEFTYEYLGNGTHIKKCTKLLDNTATNEYADSSSENPTEEGGSEDVNVDTENNTEPAATHCDFEIIEPCTYNEEGFCLYCKAEKPKEKEEFTPSISFSISNQSFTTGGPNPVISVSISQEDYDIAYAQVCFANYGENKFINVGLAQGKYFDFLTDEFVYTSNDCWCASPDITADYSSGIYSLRSIYVRSTTGESIHFSIESDSLPEEYQNIDISLNMDAVQSDISNIMDKPLIDIPAFYDDKEDVEAMDVPESIPEVIPDISEDKPRFDKENYSIPSEPSSPETNEKTNTEPIQEENIEDESEKLIEEPLLEEPAITQTNDNENNDNSQSIINDTITETIIAEEEQTPISSDSTEAPNVNNENTNEETAQTEETTPTTNDDQQSSITQFFNSIFKFVKKLFKWW